MQNCETKVVKHAPLDKVIADAEKRVIYAPLPTPAKPDDEERVLSKDGTYTVLQERDEF